MIDPRGFLNSSLRDKLAEEILDSFAMPDIIAAAATILGRTLGFGEYSMEQIMEFIAGLDYDGLLELQELAHELKGKGHVDPIH